MLHGEVLQVTREMKRYFCLCAACNASLIQTFSWVFASLHSSTLNSRNLAFIFRLILKFWIAKDRVGTNIIWFNYILKLSIFEIFWYILVFWYMLVLGLKIFWKDICRVWYRFYFYVLFFYFAFDRPDILRWKRKTAKENSGGSIFFVKGGSTISKILLNEEWEEEKKRAGAIYATYPVYRKRSVKTLGCKNRVSGVIRSPPSPIHAPFVLSSLLLHPLGRPRRSSPFALSWGERRWWGVLRESAGTVTGRIQALFLS